MVDLPDGVRIKAMAAGAAGWLDDKLGIDVSRVYAVAKDRLAEAKAEQEPGASPAAAGSAAGRAG